jgi:hypothetical protein
MQPERVAALRLLFCKLTYETGRSVSSDSKQPKRQDLLNRIAKKGDDK